MPVTQQIVVRLTVDTGVFDGLLQWLPGLESRQSLVVALLYGARRLERARPKRLLPADIQLPDVIHLLRVYSNDPLQSVSQLGTW